MRDLRILGAALLFAALLNGCGSGGGGGSFPHQPPGTSPTISNLRVSPTTALQNQGDGQIDVEVVVDFSDREGDVDYMAANLLDSSGTILYVLGDQLDHLVGQTSGEARATLSIPTETIADYTLRIWLVDQSVRASTRLEILFSVTTAAAKAMQSIPMRRTNLSIVEAAGRLYFIGGRLQTQGQHEDGLTARIDIYDPKRNSWAEGVSLPVPIANAASIAVDDEIYIIGGESTNGKALRSVFTFNVEISTWVQQSDLPYSLHSATVVKFADSLYVLGGRSPGVEYDSVLRLDLGLGSWSAVSPMNLTRVYPCSDVIDGQFVVYGGTRDMPTSRPHQLDEIEIYNPLLDIWTVSTFPHYQTTSGRFLHDRYLVDCRP